MSDSLQTHVLHHLRPPCPSSSPRVCLSSCPLHWWCHPAISSSDTPFFLSHSFPASGTFSNESSVCIRWSKYWSFSFSISPYSEYSRLISLKIDWFDLLAVQDTFRSLFQQHSLKASIWQLGYWSIFTMQNQKEVIKFNVTMHSSSINSGIAH